MTQLARKVPGAVGQNQGNPVEGAQPASPYTVAGNNGSAVPPKPPERRQVMIIAQHETAHRYVRYYQGRYYHTRQTTTRNVHLHHGTDLNVSLHIGVNTGLTPMRSTYRHWSWNIVLRADVAEGGKGLVS